MNYQTLALLMIFFISPTSGADRNGYTAKYECRAGGSYCDVDVAALTNINQACQQTISPSTSWNNIDWSKDYICLAAGDHTWKGTLTIKISGTASKRKVLRYHRSGDTNDEPWNQTDSSRAKLHAITLDGADYWIIHRLNFPSADVSDRIFLMNGASDNIVNRVLVEGRGTNNYFSPYSAVGAWNCSSGTADRVTLQNSVIRNNGGIAGTDPVAIAFACGDDVHIVNNEVYDWSSKTFMSGGNGAGEELPGLILENNDLYLTSAMYNGSGRAKAESPITLKAAGTSSNPARLIHNRIWGARYSDTSQCCIGGEAGATVIINPADPPDGNHYILLQDNIMFDSQRGIGWANGMSLNQSIVGNILYKINEFTPGTGFATSHAMEVISTANTEIYLNTIIDASQYSISYGSDSHNTDIKCNVLISSGGREGGTADATTQADNNAFYDTPKFTNNGGDNNIMQSISTRSATTNYSIGNMIRWSPMSACTSTSNPACFLYKAVTSGTSSSSTPSPCTSLGCTFTDGGVTWLASRGPYSFYRKLRTSPEQYVIPYARVHPNAQEGYACPANFMSRKGIGISD
jgi:hypothetical protein